MQPEHYSIKQLCETAGISRRTAYRLLERGILRATLVGVGTSLNGRMGQYEIARADWDSFFARRDEERVRLKRPGLRYPAQPWTVALIPQFAAAVAGQQ